MKKVGIIVCMLVLLIPLKVQAAAITSAQMSLAGEQTEGTYFNANFNISFSGLNKNSENSDGIYLVAFELSFDDTVLDITGITSTYWDSIVYKEGSNYYVLSIADETLDNKCIDNFLACSNYSANLEFFVKETDKTETNITLTQVGAGAFKVDTESLEYWMENMQEIEYSPNQTQKVKINKSQTPVAGNSKTSIIETQKPAINNTTIQEKVESANKNTPADIPEEPQPVEHSSNNYLKDLSIKNYKIKFTKEKQNYTITIPKKIKSLEVTATPEDEKATYEITDTDNLKKNDTIKIIVTAENKEKRTYVINVKKETGKEDNTTGIVNKLNQVALIIGGAVIVIIILAMIISYYQKRQLTKWIENQKR